MNYHFYKLAVQRLVSLARQLDLVERPHEKSNSTRPSFMSPICSSIFPLYFCCDFDKLSPHWPHGLFSYALQFRYSFSAHNESKVLMDRVNERINANWKFRFIFIATKCNDLYVDMTWLENETKKLSPEIEAFCKQQTVAEYATSQSALNSWMSTMDLVRKTHTWALCMFSAVWQFFFTFFPIKMAPKKPTEKSGKRKKYKIK